MRAEFLIATMIALVTGAPTTQGQVVKRTPVVGVVADGETFQAVILPESRFSLIAPWPTEVITAPRAGQVVFPAPPHIQQLREGLFPPTYETFEDLPADDPSAIAILKLPKDVELATFSKAVSGAILLGYVAEYGLGTRLHETANFPSDPTSWQGPSPEQNAFLSALISKLPDDENSLTGILSKIDNNTEDQTDVDSFFKLARAANGQFARISFGDDKAMLRQCIVYKIRELEGLNSARFNVAYGNNRLPNAAPNKFKTQSLGHGKWGIWFQVGRYSDSDNAGMDNLGTFIDYWSKVSDKSLFNEDDWNALEPLNVLALNRPGISSMAKNKLAVEREVVAVMIEDAKQALDTIKKWRSGEQAVWDYLHASPNPSAAKFAVDLKRLDPLLSADDIKIITSPIQPSAWARSAGGGGFPPSNLNSYAYAVDQWRPARSYTGKVLEVAERTSESTSVYSLDAGLLLIHGEQFPLTNSVKVPASPGFSDWKNAYFGLKADAPITGVDATAALTIHRAVDEAEDPFRDLVWQMAVSVTPSLNAIFTTPTTDEYYQASQLASLYRTELERQIAVRAIAVRQTAYALIDESKRTLASWRGGHFSVPEPAIVEIASVAEHDKVTAGQTIAILRPLYRFRLSATIDSRSPLAAKMITGSTVKFKLNCSSGVGASSEQNVAAGPEQPSAMRLLDSLKTNWFRSTLFDGNVVAVNRDPIEAAFLGQNTFQVTIAFAIPTESQSIPLTSALLGDNDIDRATSSLRAAGVPILPDLTSVGISNLRPPQGPLSPGDRCEMSLVTPS